MNNREMMKIHFLQLACTQEKGLNSLVKSFALDNPASSIHSLCETPQILTKGVIICNITQSQEITEFNETFTWINNKYEL